MSRFAVWITLGLAGALPLYPQKIVFWGGRAEQLRELQAAAPGATVVAGSEENAAAQLADADAIIEPPNGRIFALAPKLRWVQTNSAGIERFVGELRNRPVTLTNCRIIQGPNIADHAMALLLGLTREIPRAVTMMAREEWGRGQLRLVELNGKTAVIVGVGGIGMQIAQRAHAFGMTVIGVDPRDVPYTFFLKKVVRPDRLDEVLPQADVLFVAAPLTAETRGMIGERQFHLMKKDSFFIAVSRGGLYQTPALVKALDSKHLAGAGLDVTDPEPLPKGHPLWKFDNVIITPHSAGGSDGVSARRMELYKENLRRFVAGEPLLHIVDKEKGY